MATTSRARITYHAGDRSFIWLHKEQPYSGFREALRKKLSLPEGANFSVKQLLGTTRLDIDNEDEYEAFCDFARTEPTAEVEVSQDISTSSRQVDRSGAALPEIISAIQSTSAAPLSRKRKPVASDPDLSASAQKPSERRKKRRKNAQALADQVAGSGITISNRETSVNAEPPGHLLKEMDSGVKALPPDVALGKNKKQKSKKQTDGVPQNLEVTKVIETPFPATEPAATAPGPSASKPNPKKRPRLAEEKSDASIPLKPKRKRKKEKAALQVEDDTASLQAESVPQPNRVDVAPAVATASLVSSTEDTPKEKVKKRKQKDSAEGTLPDDPSDIPGPSEEALPKSNKKAKKGTRTVANDLAENETDATQRSSKPETLLADHPEKGNITNSSGGGSTPHPLAHTTTPEPADSRNKKKRGTTIKRAAEQSPAADEMNVVPATVGDERLKIKKSRKKKEEPEPSIEVEVSSEPAKVKRTKKIRSSEPAPEDPEITLIPAEETKAATSSPPPENTLPKTRKSRKKKETTALEVEPAISTKVPVPITESKDEAEYVEQEPASRGGKKSRGPSKRKKDMSNAPKVDIHEIMNQLLAKNKSAHTPPTEPEPVVVEQTSTQEPPLSVPELKVFPSSPVAASSPITRKSRPVAGASCPVCNQRPFHLRFVCPVITDGPESIKARIEELQLQQPIDQKLIEDLQRFYKKAIEKRARSQSSLVDRPSSPGLVAERSTEKGALGSDDLPSEEAQVAPKPATLLNSDDDLDTLLRGPKVVSVRNRVLEEIGVDDSEEEREEIEVEDEEQEPKKSRNLSQRHRRVVSSDEDESSNENDVLLPEIRPQDPPDLQVVSQSNATDPVDLLKAAPIPDLAADEATILVPSSDDQMQIDETVTQHHDLQSISETPAHSSPSMPQSSKKISARLSELKASKSVLNYLHHWSPDRPDPIEPSEPVSLQYPRSSVETEADPIEEVGQKTNSQTIPIQSTPAPALSRRMKNRNGTAVMSGSTPVLFSLKTTPVRALENVLPDTVRAMRPPPPPLLLPEENIPGDNPRGTAGSQANQSLIEWTALKHTQSPIAPTESSLVDELRSSPGNDLAVEATPVASQRHKQEVSQTQETPLFLPGTSQYPIPESHLLLDDDEPVGTDGSGSSSDSEEEPVKTVGNLQWSRSRSFGASVPYRGLALIASQGSVFASPLLTPVSTSLPSRSNGKPSVFGDDAEDEEEEEDSSSSGSEDEEKSHIPKERRAGAKRRERKGLFATL